MSELWSSAVAAAAWPVELVAGLLSGAGAAAWGWSVVILVVVLRLGTLPLVVRQQRRRILGVRLHAEAAAGRDLRGRAERAAVKAEVDEAFRALAPAPRWADWTVAAPQVLVAVLVWVWASGAPEAADHGFHLLTRLDAPVVTQPPAAWLSATFLGAGFLALAVLTHASAGRVAGHQVVLDRLLAPLFFTLLGLLLPAAVLVAFVTSVLVSLAGVVGAVLTQPLAQVQERAA